MTNTHITIGGHKVTTNKVGQIHTATNATGVTGTITYCVTNGICFVQLSSVVKSASGKLTGDVPTPKMAGLVLGHNSFDIAIASDGLYIYGSTTGANDLVSYPVADSWSE